MQARGEQKIIDLNASTGAFTEIDCENYSEISGTFYGAVQFVFADSSTDCTTKVAASEYEQTLDSMYFGPIPCSGKKMYVRSAGDALSPGMSYGMGVV